MSEPIYIHPFLKNVYFRQQFDKHFSDISVIVRFIIMATRLYSFDMPGVFKILRVFEINIPFSSIYVHYFKHQTIDMFIMSLARAKTFRVIIVDDDIISALENVTKNKYRHTFDEYYNQYLEIQWNSLLGADSEELERLIHKYECITELIECTTVDQLLQNFDEV